MMYYSKYSDRNDDICKLRDEGYTYNQIASKYNISYERVRQIIAKHERYQEWDNGVGLGELGTMVLQYCKRTHESIRHAYVIERRLISSGLYDLFTINELQYDVLKGDIKPGEIKYIGIKYLSILHNMFLLNQQDDDSGDE